MLTSVKCLAYSLVPRSHDSISSINIIFISQSLCQEGRALLSQPTDLEEGELWAPKT